MVLALAAIQRGDHRRLRIWLLATVLFGATFIGGQVYEFTEFYREGLHLGTNLFGTTFFVLTGLHGAHVTVGIIWLLSLWGLSMQGRLPTREVRGGRDRRSVLALRRHRVDLHLHRHLPDPDALRTLRHDRQAPTWSRSTPEDAAAGAAAASSCRPAISTPVAAEEHSHPAPRQYVLIAVVLVILTAVEVATSYLEGHVNSNLLIVALGIMAAVKFFLVARLVHAHEAGLAGVPAAVHHRASILAVDRVRHRVALLLEHGPEVVGDRARRRRLSRLGTAPRRLAARRRDRGGLRGRGDAARARGSRRPGSAVVTRFQITTFSAGLLAMWVASDWPIHDLGERYFFWVHMVQHMTYAIIAAPLLLIGTPDVAGALAAVAALAAAHGALPVAPDPGDAHLQLRDHRHPHPGGGERVAAPRAAALRRSTR